MEVFMSKLNAYFVAHKTLTLTLMWGFFFLAIGYGLTELFLLPELNFGLIFIPAAVALYFRIMYAKASYNPVKDKLSPEYIPYSQRPENQKRMKKKKAHK